MDTNQPCIVSALLFIITGSAGAQATQPAPPEAKPYTLFNPRPQDQRRPLEADRPDVTESPRTVDAGALQLEMSFVEAAWNGGQRQIDVAPFLFKVGLTHSIDLQLGFAPFSHARNDGGETDRGIGPTQIRLKMNLCGNDEGTTALGLMPFITLPTGDDDFGPDEVEGGLIIPFAVDLNESLSLGLMAEFDLVHIDETNDYDLEFVHTAALGFPVAGALGGYVEYVGIWAESGDNDYRALFGGGGVYSLNENASLDAGVMVGLTGDADDLTLFAGMTLRF